MHRFVQCATLGGAQLSVTYANSGHHVHTYIPKLYTIISLTAIARLIVNANC